MRFIDLFAGLGGFHLALKRLGHECVFACEMDETLGNLYEKNFGIIPAKDIRELDVRSIPSHDILCAGFPCQPFSKAGDQEGLDDPDSGGLFFNILSIVQQHKPKYVILENVPNFARHNGGHTWQKIEDMLADEGYYVDLEKLSPHQFNVPQFRERIYIIGSLEPLNGFKWPEPITKLSEVSIRSILDKNPSDRIKIPENLRNCLAVWQDFLDKWPINEKLPSFPIWSMEFGATYPYDGSTPSSITVTELRKYKGSHGQALNGSRRKKVFQSLPSYAKTGKKFPPWKIRFIKQNRELYDRHKAWLDEWIPQILKYSPSFQKFEWNCQKEERELSNFIIQIRASGIRVKRPTAAPSLVAMTATQIPIIAWEERYITANECKKLQSMDELQFLPETRSSTCKSLGNAVNVNVVELVAKALIK